MTVAILFARSDSNYYRIPDVEVYDMVRDARNYDGPFPVIAHPPCRSWGRLRAFSKHRPDERNLARLAVSLVREFGGVLEHPSGSTLWRAQQIPGPGESDKWGWTLSVSQKWFGHRAEKKTWLYICGVSPKNLPDYPITFEPPKGVIRLDMRRADGTHIRKGDPDYVARLSKEENEHTPINFAKWLVSVAICCRQKF
jgi:hypothetical protein